jgi:hypothetical protein
VEECDFDQKYLFDEYVAISHRYGLKLRIHGQYFYGDGNAMVVKSLHCRREKEIACV